MTEPETLSGRELDAAVAEEVMGWEPTQPNWKGTWFKRPDGKQVCTSSMLEGTPMSGLVQWNPSINIVAAWTILTEIDWWGWEVNGAGDVGQVSCWINPSGNPVNAKAETAPLAISRCALKAVRADREGEDG